MVAQGDDAEGELRVREGRNHQLRTCRETQRASGTHPGPLPPLLSPGIYLPPPADILLLEVLQVDHGLPAHQGLLVVHRLGGKAERGR